MINYCILSAAALAGGFAAKGAGAPGWILPALGAMFAFACLEAADTVVPCAAAAATQRAQTLDIR